MVIIVFGLPGSGKSYFASRLAAKLDALYLSTDELRLTMFSNRTYSDTEKLAVYKAMLNKMMDGISGKKTIVLDGTFYKTSIRLPFEQAAQQSGEKLLYIEVTAPEEKIEERLEKPRVNSEANYDVYKKLKAVAEPLGLGHLVLDSAHDNIDAMLQKAIHYIDTYR
jgi:predicted kinase